MTIAKTKVAIIGGGCAAMAAAWQLSKPEHAGRYAITVYQLGFRLGGKGASGRGVHDRIEEHGLHLWMGFYENAFRLMRECYAELGRDPATCPIADWRDAFEPAPLVGVADRVPNGEWQIWEGA
ncbi:MAG TPA: NAD(P)-binding protein, partial [Enhygromyxa sp.]|nr:NAD(P)-binding protein [Enhygromyxa sp.]